MLHCAGRALVGESVAQPELYYRDNVVASQVMLDAMRAAGVRRIVFSSSAAVYGAPETSPIEEGHAMRPVNPYGETKRAFEGMLDWYARGARHRRLLAALLQRRSSLVTNGPGRPTALVEV